MPAGHTGELYKNGRTDRDAVWGQTFVGPRSQDRTYPFASAVGDKTAITLDTGHYYVRMLVTM